MKLTRYSFEKSVQEATPETREWLQEEFKRILESDKDYTAKCDYIGYSILSIDEKIQTLDEQIKELQAIKSHLKAAKELTLVMGAEVFESYGIEKIEGAGISSITLTSEQEKETFTLEILNEYEVINKGYAYITIDKEALIKDLQSLEGKYNLLGIAQFKCETTITPSRLKVNRRRKRDSALLDYRADDKDAA